MIRTNYRKQLTNFNEAAPGPLVGLKMTMTLKAESSRGFKPSD